MSKSIESMNLDELKSEIKAFIDTRFNRDENYIFVSYSHYDQKDVLRKVVEWIRAGFNVYIDLDFENHGSEQNWVKMMEEMIRRSCCVQIVCFRSRNYYFSYASLIELLLLRSEYLANLRQTNPLIPIEVIILSDQHQFGQRNPSEDDKRFEKEYKDRYIENKNKLGNKKFFDDKQVEKEYLSYGLNTLLKKMDPDHEPNVEKAIANLELKFSDGFKDFYPGIAYYIDNWFRINDMNGNFKELINTGTLNVFETRQVYKFSSDDEPKQPDIISNSKPDNATATTITSGSDYLRAVEALVKDNPQVIDNWKIGQIYSHQKENARQQKECTLPDGTKYYVNLNINIQTMAINYDQLLKYISSGSENNSSPVARPDSGKSEVSNVGTVTSEYTVSKTMINYHALQLGAAFDVGLDVDTTIVMNGHEYRSRSHKINKGRFDVQMRELDKDNHLQLGEKLKVTLDRASKRITIERI